ncbi:putative membrane protein [Aliiruegeria haliotis]|uniref:Putative membrane protein n=2 Tax=Aliiruegeria haliotis TaxID=1280846 RepID=A0A2T0RF47_9RHOB|nr:putative membrane protein [Aliiruegeria haliotis]
MNSYYPANKTREELFTMAREQMVQLKDSVVGCRQDGEIKLDQSVNLAAAGALGGAWWGVPVGMLAGVFTAGTGTVFAALSVAGAAGGAAGGAMSGLMSDVGNFDEMMEKTSHALDADKAILFIMGRTGAPDKVLERLSEFGGEVVTSSPTADIDARINEALAEGEG